MGLARARASAKAKANKRKSLPVARAKRLLRNCLRTKPWLKSQANINNNSTYKVNAWHSPFATFDKDLCLAEILCFENIAKTPWTMHFDQQVPLSVAWVPGLSTKFVQRTPLVSSDIIILKDQLFALKRRLHDVVYRGWMPLHDKVFGGKQTLLPDAKLTQIMASSRCLQRH